MANELKSMGAQNLTTFPSGVDSPDLCIQKALLIEEYCFIHPQVPFLILVHTTDQDQDGKVSSADAKGTVMDDLWGEALPPGAYQDGEWTQPHENPCVVDPSETRLYRSPVIINAKVEFNPSEKTLTKWGIDKPATILITLCKPQLELLKIVPKIGDRLTWGPSFLTIDFVDPVSRWTNSSYFLEYKCTARREWLGS